jgi:hypothetical protein
MLTLHCCRSPDKSSMQRLVAVAEAVVQDINFETVFASWRAVV